MPNHGNTNLAELLSNLKPVLSDQKYGFCTLKNANYGDFAHLNPIGSFAEKEGMTLVVPVEQATEYEIQIEQVFRKITLSVHSSLQAVGLTQAVSEVLAGNDIPCNMVAGFYHDHVFVPDHLAEQAFQLMLKLQ